MSAPPTTTPVYGPRPFHLTDNDHRAVVLTVSILFIIYAFMVLGMRLASKYRSMRIEDWLSVAATALAVPQFITVIAATALGFGESYPLHSRHDADTVARCIRASDVLLLLSLFTAKCSVIWLCKRLFAVGQHHRHLLCKIAIGACGVWCLGSILGATIGCNASQTIELNQGKCAGLVTRWAVIGSFDAILEVLIFGLSVVVVFPLQMSWQRKLQALMCFVLRLPIIILIALHVKYLSDFTSASNAGVALTRPILFRESELLYSLLSASIPTLNQYLRKFDTKQISQFGYTPGQYGSGGRSYQMDSMTRKHTTGNKKTWTNNSKSDERLGKSTDNSFNPPLHTQYHATVEGPQANDGVSNASHEDGSLGRNNSDEYIIRKDVKYEVRHED